MNPVLCTVVTLSVVGLASGLSSCFTEKFDKCEDINRGRFANALNAGVVNYRAACDSLKELRTCGEAVECDGQRWDSADDLLTYMIQFIEESGLCGGETLVNECGRVASQSCLNDFVVDLKSKDTCQYYGNYAACVVRQGGSCDDDTLMIVATLMMDQLADNYPVVVGGSPTPACPNWSTQYAKYIFRK